MLIWVFSNQKQSGVLLPPRAPVLLLISSTSKSRRWGMARASDARRTSAAGSMVGRAPASTNSGADSPADVAAGVARHTFGDR